jgi:hypothetical protein
MAKIESLRGTTPAEIFQSGLENLGEIQAIAAAVLWKDGRVTAGWSNVDSANPAHHRRPRRLTDLGGDGAA